VITQLLLFKEHATAQRFLYVPLPVFSAPDDVGWLLKAKQCGEDLKLFEIRRWISPASETFTEFHGELLKRAVTGRSFRGVPVRTRGKQLK
jgi:hypothetical protein